MDIEDKILDMVTQNTSKLEDLKRMIKDLNEKIDYLEYQLPYKRKHPWICPDITFPEIPNFPDSPMCQCHMRKY